MGGAVCNYHCKVYGLHFLTLGGNYDIDNGLCCDGIEPRNTNFVFLPHVRVKIKQ